MDHREGLEFIRNYFNELFVERNLEALDVYLHEDYFDDDIGDPEVDHRQNSKEFLAELFRDNPGIGIEVMDVMTRDNVITAFLKWYEDQGQEKRMIRKGVAIFVLSGKSIIRRHTFIYAEK